MKSLHTALGTKHSLACFPLNDSGQLISISRRIPGKSQFKDVSEKNISDVAFVLFP